MLNEECQAPASGILCIQAGSFRLCIEITPLDLNKLLGMHRLSEGSHSSGYKSSDTTSFCWKYLGWDSSVLVVEEKTKAVTLSKHKETDFLPGLQNLSELTGGECSVDSFV